MNAVATVERTSSPKREVRAEIEAMADQFKMALPSHIKVDKFQRVVLTAVMSDPELLHADRRSLIASVTRAAQDGLLPDKREGALVIFNQKVSKKGEQDEWIKAVQWMPMIAGVLKKVRQSGEIASITANIVYDKDTFIWSQGDNEAIEHQPPQLGEDRGKAIGVYAIATLKDGYKIREVMDINEIEKVRKVSKTGQYGPWKDWWEEMAKKTVIRRLSKRLPMSTDIEGVINDEATEADFSKSTIAALGPSRMTREALANHAEPETGRADHEHGDQFDETKSQQPSTSEPSPPVDDTAAVTGRSDADRQDVEASASAPKFTPPSLFQQLCDRLDMADDLAAVQSVQEEFDAREAEIDFADQPALLDAITSAKERIEEGNQ